MKRTISLALVLALAVCMFAGCTKNDPAVSPDAQSEPAAVEAVGTSGEASEPAVDAAEPSGQPSDEDTQSEAAEVPDEPTANDTAQSGTYHSDGTYTSPHGITYPLGDGSYEVELFMSFGFFDFGFDSPEDFPRVPDIREQTGINFTFRTVNFSSQSEQFNLMIASGDWTDIFRSAELYSGGNAQAYEDEVILDLLDLIPAHAPDYWSRVEGSNQATIDSMYTEGHVFQVQTITNAVYNDTGTYIRYDWLEELGMDNPRNLSQFTDALYAFKEQKGAEIAYDCPTTGTVANLSAAFGSALYGIGGSTIGAYREGDTVVAGITSNGFRDYIEWFAKCYQDGLFDREFYVSEGTEQELYTGVAAGKIGCFPSTANSVLAMEKYSAGDPVKIGGLNFIENEDGIFDFMNTATMTDKGYSLAADVADPGLTLEFLNYFFTEPGSRLCNYGKLDVSYTVDEQGNITYTDLVLGSDDPGLVQFQQGYSDLPYFKDVFASSFQFNATQLNDLAIFSGSYVQSTDDHVIPSAAALNVTETASIANCVTDVTTYADEAVLKFMIGSEPLTDESWNAYVKKCQSFGIDQAVEVYQSAYDQYLRGERTQAAAAGGPPPDGAAPGAPPPA